MKTQIKLIIYIKNHVLNESIEWILKSTIFELIAISFFVSWIQQNST
jgi:hypothetical protein